MHGGCGCCCRRVLVLVECRSRGGDANSRSLFVLCVQVQAKGCTVAAMLILILGVCLSKARVAGLLKFSRNVATYMLQFCGLVLEFGFFGNPSESLILGDSII